MVDASGQTVIPEHIGPEEFGWLINDFVETMPEVMRAILVSSDGFLLHSAGDTNRDAADGLSAITSALLASGNAIGELIGENNGCEQIMLRFPGCTFLFMWVGDLAGLAALVQQGAKIGEVGKRMAGLVAGAGRVLTPELRDGLAALLPQPQMERT